MAWKKLCPAADCPEGEVVGLQLEEKHIAVYCHDGEHFATSNICTHQFALLSEGYFEDGCIECPLHQGRFDVRTGKAMCAPLTADIQIYPVKVDGETIYVDI